MYCSYVHSQLHWTTACCSIGNAVGCRLLAYFICLHEIHDYCMLHTVQYNYWQVQSVRGIQSLCKVFCTKTKTMVEATRVKPHDLRWLAHSGVKEHIIHTPFYIRRQGQLHTDLVIHRTLGTSKVYFRVLDSEPLIIRSLDRVLLKVLPV